jgi:hypothetical protein
MTTWSIKVTDHPEIYLVVAESKKDAISYLEAYLAENLNISNVSEMDDGTIIALDALDAEDDVNVDEEDEDEEDEDDEDEDWDEDDDYFDLGDDEDDDEEEEDDEED